MILLVRSFILAILCLNGRYSINGRRTTTMTPTTVFETTADDESVTCSSCGSQEFRRSHRIESIRSDILRKLRMTSPPNMTGVKIPDLPHLKNIIEKIERDTVIRQSGHYSDSEMFTTIKVFRISQSGPLTSAPVVYFDLTSQELRHPNQVASAFIGIFIRKLEYENPLWKSYILIYGNRDHSLIVRKQITYNDTNNWIFFNLTTQVQEWIKNNNSNQGLDILCTDNSGLSLVITEPKNEEEEAKRSYLSMDIIKTTNRRSTRAVDQSLSCEQECCRYPLVVSFEDFGWDWVIVPKTYPAFYCEGNCPLVVLERGTHSHVAQQNTRFSGLCCAPNQISPISMLYYDERMNIIYGQIPGMVVDKCGCI